MNNEINKLNFQREKEGLWVEYDENTRWIGNYLNGQKDGSWSCYNKNKIIKIINYDNGLKNGLSYFYSEVGHLIKIIEFENDRINGKVSFYANDGTKIAVYVFINDKLHEVEYYLLHDESPPKSKDFYPDF